VNALFISPNVYACISSLLASTDVMMVMMYDIDGQARGGLAESPC